MATHSAMKTNRSLLLRVIAGALLLAISGWWLQEGSRGEAPAPGAREILMLGGVVTLVPITAPFFHALLAGRRD